MCFEEVDTLHSITRHGVRRGYSTQGGNALSGGGSLPQMLDTENTAFLFFSLF